MERRVDDIARKIKTFLYVCTIELLLRMLFMIKDLIQ